MATSVYSFGDSTLKLRYREPYLSESLNNKYQFIVSSGIYDGFSPSVTGAPALTLNLLPGQYASVAAVTSSLDSAYQISLHIPAPTVLSLDLSGFASKTVAVVLEASYDRPSVTSANVRVYDLATETVPAYACVVCRVVVPASGLIPAANITLTDRTLPWDLRGRDAIPLIDIVKNGDFHFWSSAQTSDLPAVYWSPTGSGGSFGVGNVVGPLGVTDNSLLGIGAGPSTPCNAKIVQKTCIPVTPSTMRVRVQAYYQQGQTPVAGYPAIKVKFKRADTNADTDTVELPLIKPLGGVNGAWYYLETFVTVDTASLTYGKYLSSVEIDLNGTTWPLSSEVFRVTNVSVEVEQAGKSTDLLLENTGDTRHTSLSLLDTTDVSPAANYTRIFYTSATNTLSIANATAGSVRVIITGRLDSGSVYTPVLDSTSGLLIGQTASGIIISQVAALTRVAGNFKVDGSSEFTSATFSATVLAGTIDSTSALNIGTTSQTGLTIGRTTVATTTINGLTTEIGTAAGNGVVNISRIGVFTNIKGSLLVSGGSSFAGTVTAGIYVHSPLFDGNTSTLQIGTSTTYTTSLTLGRVGAATTINGLTTDIGTAAANGAVTISRSGVDTTIQGPLILNEGVSVGTVVATTRVQTPALDGNVGPLAIGTDATRTTSVTIGRTGISSATTTIIGYETFVNSDYLTLNTGSMTVNATGGYCYFNPVVVFESIIQTPQIDGRTSGSGAGPLLVGNSADTTALTLGRGGANTTINGNTLGISAFADVLINGTNLLLGTSTSTVYLGLGSGSGSVYLYSPLDGVGGATVKIATQTANALQLGRVTGATTTTTTLNGDTIEIGLDANTDIIRIGHSGITLTLNSPLYAVNGVRTLNYDGTGSTATVSIATGAFSSGAVSISKTGQTTTFNGAVTVAEGGTVNGTVTFNSGSTILLSSGAALTATAITPVFGSITVSTLDRTTGVLSIGTATAASVSIGRSGQMTTVNGQVTITQAAYFNADVQATAGTLFADTIEAAVSPASGTLLIGTLTTTSALTVGRSGIPISYNGVHTFNGAVAVSSLAASTVNAAGLYANPSVSDNNKILVPAYGAVICTAADLTVNVGTPASIVFAASSRGKRNVTTGSAGFTSLPAGDYAYCLTTNISVDVIGTIYSLAFKIKGTNVAFTSTLAYDERLIYGTNGGNLADTTVYLSASGIVTATADGATLSVEATVLGLAGSSVSLGASTNGAFDLSLSVHRVGVAS